MSNDLVPATDGSKPPANNNQDLVVSNEPADMPPEKLAEHFWRSGMFPDLRSVSQAVVKIQAGKEMGFGAFASINGLNFIKGKPTPSGLMIAAAIEKSNGFYDYNIDSLDEKGCRITFFRKGKKRGSFFFGPDEARRAGLAGGDNYRKFPLDMYYNRAMSGGAKKFCPLVFGGCPFYTEDELETDRPTPEGPAHDVQPSTIVDVEPEPVAAAPEQAYFKLLAELKLTPEKVSELLKVPLEVAHKPDPAQAARLLKLLEVRRACTK